MDGTGAGAAGAGGGEPFVEYAHKLAAALRDDLFRAEVDDSHDSFNKRIRTATVQKIPNVFVIGGNEASESVTWRAGT